MEDETPYDDVTHEDDTEQVEEVDERDQRIDQLVAELSSLQAEIATQHALVAELTERNAQLLLEVPGAPGEDDNDEDEDTTPSSIDDLFYGTKED